MKGILQKVRVLIIMCAICLTVCVGGCAQPSVSEDEKVEDEAIQIGFSFDSFVIERWQRDRDVFVSTAKELGAEVNVQNANGDLEEQLQQIDYFIKKKVDVIVIVQVADESDKMIEAVERAKKAGIPVIAYDRMIKDADADLYISFDNKQVGKLMAEHMKSHLDNSGEIVQICGPLADNNVPQVMAGFDTVIDGSSIEIEETDHADGWLAEVAFSKVSNYLAANKAPGGIMCGNDSLAGQAIKALSEHRLAGSICVVGQDADLDACQRIVEGTQCMTVYKPVEKMARRTAELAVALANGEELNDVSGKINDGSHFIPYEKLEPLAVTKDNMDDIITGKYHDESDIYLNVK